LHNSPRTLHCYIFAPLEQRIANVMEHQHLNQEEASEMVAHRDYEHEAYLRRYYGTHQERPELYHLLINTGLFPFDLAANLIRETLPLVGAFSNAGTSPIPSIDEADRTETLGAIATAETTETEES
ncbi:MAG TPA: cytidylate kinase family protein, partial [Ktedonobacteraceae bacterium]|nr:cytidylate kinase family protein [Ktedonobacteraceae bacterium]